MISRIVQYARDSGGDEQERSCQRQIDEGIAFCESHGYTCIETYIDERRSGTTMQKRDALRRMLDALSPGRTLTKIDAVLFWRRSRMARDIDDAQYITAILRQGGYEIIYIADTIPHDNSYGRIVETIIDIHNQKFSDDLSMDVKSGLRNAIESGSLPGRVPTGYLQVRTPIGHKRNGDIRYKSNWIHDKLTIEKVRLAYEMLVAGSSYTEILTACELFTSRSSLKSFFSNPIYRGDYIYSGVVYENVVEPAVSRELWNAANKILENRHNRIKTIDHPRAKNTGHLMYGVLYCECGSQMIASSKNDYRYYVCREKRKYKKCKLTSRILIKKVDEKIIAWLSDVFSSSDSIKIMLIEYKKRRENEIENLNEKKIALSKRQRDIENQIRNIIEFIKSGFSGASLTGELRKLEHEHQNVIAQIETIGEITEINIPEDLASTMSQKLREKLKSAPRSQLRELVYHVIERAVWKSDKTLTITYRYPDPDLYLNRSDVSTPYAFL